MWWVALRIPGYLIRSSGTIPRHLKYCVMGCELTPRQPPHHLKSRRAFENEVTVHQQPSSSIFLPRRHLASSSTIASETIYYPSTYLQLRPSEPRNKTTDDKPNTLPPPSEQPTSKNTHIHTETKKKMATPSQPQDITAPITPARFAAALKDLSAASLHLKVLEIRNSLAHLAHSNAQLRPFAEGAAAAPGGVPGEPDADCADAIRENEAVIERMRGRIELVRAEVEERGLSWREFEAKDELEDDEPGVVPPPAATAEVPGASAAGAPVANGVNGHAEGGGAGSGANGAAASRGNPWEDGTFQTGVIRNGEIHMDATPNRQGSSAASRQTNGGGAGGSLTDEELRRRLEERLAEDNEDEDGGLHL